MEASEAIDTQADGDAAAPAFASGGGNGIFASPTDIAAASSGKTKVAFSVHDGDTASNSFHGAAASSIVEAACGDAGDIDVVAAADSSSRPLAATASTDDGDGSATAGVGAIRAEGGSGLLASEQAEMATIDDDATETTSCDLALAADGAAAVEEDTASSAAASVDVADADCASSFVVDAVFAAAAAVEVSETSRSALAGTASDSAVADAHADSADSAATVESDGTENVAVRCNVDEDDAADGSAAESRHVSEINQPK